MPTNNVEPVGPNDIIIEHVIHPSMIRAVNMLLSRFNGKSLTLKEKEIVTKFLELEPDISRDVIFDNHWLDFEGIYIRKGWKVSYDRPGYDENYDPYYIFSV